MKISLGGSSVRPPTSAELVARAKASRKAHLLRRARTQAALSIQSLWRRRLALRAAARQLHQQHTDNPATAATQLLLLAGALDLQSNSLRANIQRVQSNLRSRYFLPDFVTRLADALPIFDPTPSQPLPLSQPMLSKTIIILIASATHRLSSDFSSSDFSPTPAPDDLAFAHSALAAAATLAPHLTPIAAKSLAQHGLAAHISHLFLALAPLPQQYPGPPAIPSLLNILITLLAHPHTPTHYARLLYLQFLLALPVFDTVLRLFPSLKFSPLIPNIMAALASATPSPPDDGFAWDVATSLSDLDTKKATLALSNVLELGDIFWGARDRNTLLSFVAVLSSLLQGLPKQVVFMKDAADAIDSDDDLTDPDDEMQDARALRPVMKRLSASLKRIVSEDTVRQLITAASEEGRSAVVKVCQLFNFLTRREKSLNMAFNNAIAFWRGSRTGSKPHILNTLWRLCLQGADGSDATTDTGLDVNSSRLREESAPILLVFACSYSYLLFIQDEDEMFDDNWPFSADEVREMVLVLKHYLFVALYVRPIPMAAAQRARGNARQNSADLLRNEPGLMTEVSRLLSRLYVHDSRRPFRTGEDFWLAGRGLLSSDTFLQDAVEAGPEALVKTAEAGAITATKQTGFGNNKMSSVSGAGELLRIAPYLVPFSSRAKIFQCWIAMERDLANGGQSFFPTSGRSVSVRRKFIFEDAFRELNKMGPELKSTIRVKFIDEHGLEEAGIDGGGVFKEFMYEVLRRGFSPFLYGLFKATSDGHLYPHPDAPIANENFKVQFGFLGRLLGKAIFDGVLVDIPLARFFMSKILGQFYYPSDLKSLDPELHRNMKYLKNCPKDVVEDLGLNFTVAINAYGTTKEVELVRNGKNISVTAENRIEYMHRVANFRMNTQIKEQSEAFLRGFSEIISPQFIRLFSHEELQLLISGKTGKIDIDDLRHHTRYSGGYDENTDVIKWFWQAMSELEAEDQSKMLQFVTSSPRAPLLGFSYLVPGFCIHRAEGDIRLPTASTCMNLLKLPQYKSLDVVREKLKYALHSNAGFDLS